MKNLDLDVDAPDQVAPVLRRAAEAYEESATELNSAWQDKSAGWPWHVIATVLKVAAKKIEDNT